MDKLLILKRLAFIKYLLSQANNLSALPEPINASSLLTFHDALELLLQLCAEELNIKKETKEFLNYWDCLNPILSKNGNLELTQKESMRKLNSSRTSLKHRGILPSRSDIENYRVISNTFFEETCKNVFNIDVKEISLVELISYTKTKEYLSKANKYFEENNLPDCIKNIALAFEFLIRDYEKTKRNRFGRSSFFFGEDFTFIGTDLGLGNGNVSEFVEKTIDSIDSLQKVVKILSFGIDYRKFIKFSILTPKPIWTLSSNEPLITVSNNIKISKTEFDFCFDFIVESALKLQEFDFSVSKL